MKAFQKGMAAACCAASFVLAACSQGTNGAAMMSTLEARAFRITTTDLPSAHYNAPYSAILRVHGKGDSTLEWVVASGRLPDGMVFDNSRGVISGTPQAIGAWDFTIQAQLISYLGQPGPAESTPLPSALGGNTGPVVARPFVEVLGTSSVAYHLEVLAPLQGAFTGLAVGGTDIWLIDIDADGNSDGVSDFDAALGMVGLGPQRAEVIASMLEKINTTYGNAPDGTPNLDGGIAASFVVEAPAGLSAYPGISGHPGAKYFNVISVVDNGDTPSPLVGYMFQDARNDAMENSGNFNDNAAQVDFYGVFARRLANVSGQFDFEDMMAAMCCHEIGHALGLHHAEGETNTIMDATITPGIGLRFLPEQISELQGFMPGAGR